MIFLWAGGENEDFEDPGSTLDNWLVSNPVADENTAGWRIGLTYEFNPKHGAVVSYILTETDATDP